MSNPFKNQKIAVYGSFGEFNIGDISSTIRVRYILTKIKPGNISSPESELASKMKPWREVFNVEDLDFEELLQRDIDDARVAHDFIPYLLGASGDRARFFPPILSVIVPLNESGTGIEPYYQVPTNPEESIDNQYGELFEIEQMKVDNYDTSLTALRYNRQKSAFIIVDGQHRAMAVLALHRQFNKDWGDNPYASYYAHISVSPEQIKSIELPTCILYFPDLHNGKSELLKKRYDLSSVCRELFLVVNRSAKRVSESRELLLDDEDLAAHFMRRTLSSLKDRNLKQDRVAHINSISYGDSDEEKGHREVVSGRFQYSSAIAIHKIHRAISFGQAEAYTLEKNSSEVSDGRSTQNPNRPPKLLIGTDVQDYAMLPRNFGKSLPPDHLDEIIQNLGNLTDIALVNLFDNFHPFRVHNQELQNLKERFSSVHARSDNVNNQANALIFDGGGVRNVFDSHIMYLKKSMEDPQQISEILKEQLKFCQRVNKKIDDNEEEFQRYRACNFFNINYDRFFKNDNNSDAQKILTDKARNLYRTFSTQAFQLGYTMAIFTVVEELIRLNMNAHRFPFEKRLKLVQFVTELYLAALNKYFSSNEKEPYHNTLTGYITESRASVFDLDVPGFRGLLLMSNDELNEKQWRFFRYAILEIVHSSFCWDVVKAQLMQQNNESLLEMYKEAIPELVNGIALQREKYVGDAINSAVNDDKFKISLIQEQAQAKGEGKNEEQIRDLTSKLEIECKENAKKVAYNHLDASLKVVEEKEVMVNRLIDGLE